VSAPARLVLLTDRRLCEAGGHTLDGVLSASVNAGARDVVLREKDLDRTDRSRVARAALSIVAGAGGTLRIASDAELAGALGGLPVHLAAGDPVPTSGIAWGRSCHDEGEVRVAVDEGASYVTVSPVFPSSSKAGYGPPLGTAGLEGLVAAARGLPVIALGGVTAGSCAACIESGARGVAVLSAVMGAADPAAAVEQLLEALAAVEHAGLGEAPDRPSPM